MQVAFYLAVEITQVKESIPWVRCASGNVLLQGNPTVQCTHCALVIRELKVKISIVYHLIEEALASDSTCSPVGSSRSSLPPLLTLMLLLIMIKAPMFTTNLLKLGSSLPLLGKSFSLLSLSNLGRWRRKIALTCPDTIETF